MNNEKFNWQEYKDEVDYATFSCEDDKLRVYSGRVTRELFDAFRNAGFQRAPQQGCFFAVWTPGREDIALAICSEIDDEDSTLEERAEARAERFSDYSTNAKARADDAYKRSDDLVKHIPLGQPILVGHHSEKRHRNALKKSRRAMDKSVAERKKSSYWLGRSAGVLANAARKNRPDVILRRLQKLEAEKRKCERALEVDADDLYYYTERWLNEHAPQDPDADYLSIRARRDALTEEQASALQNHLDTAKVNRRKYQTRWIEHYNLLLDYWQDVYDAGPGVPADKFADKIKVGDWVRSRGSWGKVKRVNKKNGRILSVTRDQATLKPNYAVAKASYDEMTAWNPDGPFEQGEDREKED